MTPEWNVFIENFNQRKIITYNIFKHQSFLKDVQKILQKYLKDNNVEIFEKEINSILRYYFWAKCEYEIILSDWPPSPPERGFKKRKVDIYEQVTLNKKIFIEYLIKYSLDILALPND